LTTYCLCVCRESYDIGRTPSGVGAIKQARTLRLLANAYLELDGESHWQKALNAVGQLLMSKDYVIDLCIHSPLQ